MNQRIRTILIANRGEIASRVMRSCRKMGIRSLVVYAEADKDAPFVREADMAIHIGESEPQQSYLNQDKIMAAALRAGVDAIHPGYGFLSENADFARRCEAEGIIFIGPHADAIAAMGSKSKAKALMEEAGVPVLPGYKGEDQSLQRFISEAKRIGYPLLLKASAGGGGKGMRIVRREAELEAALEAAIREAQAAFGDQELLMEKYIEAGRHIEFQIFGDKHGHAIHLLERECTIQRRYQKVVEESPSPIMTEALRREMGEAALKAARALGYDNAGTVEFIYDEAGNEFYFLEVNTRLQVEHPVTEAITGLDLVQMQIESAQGKTLGIKQEEVRGKGYALEVRLYAEDPANNFLPVTGRIHSFSWPEVQGLRMETAVASGSDISIYYDPMIAKIIVWGEDREAAHDKMSFVLQHTICQGTTTNLSFLKSLLEHPEFRAGQYNTHFIDQKFSLDDLDRWSLEEKREMALAATIYGWKLRQEKRSLLRSVPSGWRNSFYHPQQISFRLGEEKIELSYRYLKDHFHFTLEDREYEVSLSHFTDGEMGLLIDGWQKKYHVHQQENEWYIHTPDIGNVKLLEIDRFPQKEKEKVKGGYESPMPSQIVKVHVSSGDSVKLGDPLLVISSMKMENTLLAEEDGILEEIYVEEGAQVESGFLLLKIKPNEK